MISRKIVSAPEIDCTTEIDSPLDSISTIERIIPYLRKKVCSKESSFLGTKILIITSTC